MRPRTIADASQVGELLTISEVGKRPLDDAVQAMVEELGHVPIDQMRVDVELEELGTERVPKGTQILLPGGSDG